MAIPPEVETAEELAGKVHRSAEWIIQQTGVERRHICQGPVEVLAAEAARAALGDGPPPDLLINASLTPRQLIPDTSVFIMRELGFSGFPSFSIHATCLSFLVALQNAAALVSSGAYRRVLVVSAERGSVCRNFEEPASAVLIGDGAAAAIIEAAPAGSPSKLQRVEMATWPDGAELTEIRGCGIFRRPDDPRIVDSDYLFHMNGPGIYKMARRRVMVLIKRLLSNVGLTQDDVDLVVPHQASGPALQALRHYGFEPSKIINIIAEYGNCVAASMPMALTVAHQNGRLKRGDRVLLLGTGAGLSVAGAVMIW